MNGPYDSQPEAVAAAHAAIAPLPGNSILTREQNRQLLARALAAAGVTNGAYDDRIADWLAGFEDATVAVVAGWVTRAAGQLAQVRLILDAFDWQHDDRRYALEQIDDVVNRGVT